MKKNYLLILVLMLSMAMAFASGCTDDEETPDGDTVDGDAVADGDDADGDDVTDGDVVAGACEGTCNLSTDKASCNADDNLCMCTNKGTGPEWQLYICAEYCANNNKIADGCGATADGSLFCLCKDDPSDGDTDDETVDGDVDVVNPSCNGSCDPENPDLECLNNDELCACDEDTSEKVVLNCDEICIEANYAGSSECSANTQATGDVCWCFTQECASDNDCIALGKDFCLTQGEGTVCAKECGLVNCSAKVGCLDVGSDAAAGCGICFDTANAGACTTDGETCDTDGYCSSLCDLTTAACYQTCDATPNECTGAGELCFPLATDAEGNITTGACVNYGADCPTCGGADGDVDDDGEEAEVVETEVEVEAEATE